MSSSDDSSSASSTVTTRDMLSSSTMGDRSGADSDPAAGNDGGVELNDLNLRIHAMTLGGAGGKERPTTSASSTTTSKSTIIGAVKHTPSVSSVASTYWAQFPGFDHLPNKPYAEEFERLRVFMGWQKNSQSYRNLERLQALCKEVGVSPVPPSTTKCKKVSSPYSASTLCP